MDLNELDALIDLFLSKDLVEIEIEEGGRRVRLRRASAALPQETAAHEQQEHPPSAAPASGGAEDELTAIESPMVGTFYRAPAPEAKPFVSEGQVVAKGQTLCIVEAMKVMNEIDSDFRARIVTVLAEDGQPVEFGEALFLVEPV